jgi:hypothetical protein
MFSKCFIAFVFLFTLTSSVNVQAAPVHERGLEKDLEDAVDIGSLAKTVAGFLRSTEKRDSLKEGREVSGSMIQAIEDALDTSKEDVSKDVKRYCKSCFFFSFYPWYLTNLPSRVFSSVALVETG